MRKKLLYFITEDWFFCSHFIARAVAAKNAGYEVFVVTQVSQYLERIQEHGLEVIPVKLRRSGVNPFNELKLLFSIFKIYWKIRPDIVHHVAFKPIIYGSIAAYLFRIKYIINAPVGMGYVFISNDRRARYLKNLIRSLLKIAWKRKNSVVIVENSDDQNLLVEENLVSGDQIRVIRGAGIDLDTYHVTSINEQDKLVVLPARMLWDKGIGEFVDAARIIRDKGCHARFVLVGDIDIENPNALSKDQLLEWVNDGIVEWWGYHDNMPEVYSKSALVCLPSYREGLPKALLEAAASGRAIVTTDVPGCREVVENTVNGLLVPPRDAAMLADAILTLINDHSLLVEMGRKGREKAESEFGIEGVVNAHLAIYSESSVNQVVEGPV